MQYKYKYIKNKTGLASTLSLFYGIFLINFKISDLVNIKHIYLYILNSSLHYCLTVCKCVSFMFLNNLTYVRLSKLTLIMVNTCRRLDAHPAVQKLLLQVCLPLYVMTSEQRQTVWSLLIRPEIRDYIKVFKIKRLRFLHLEASLLTQTKRYIKKIWCT